MTVPPPVFTRLDAVLVLVAVVAGTFAAWYRKARQ